MRVGEGQVDQLDPGNGQIAGAGVDGEELPDVGRSVEQDKRPVHLQRMIAALKRGVDCFAVQTIGKS